VVNVESLGPEVGYSRLHIKEKLNNTAKDLNSTTKSEIQDATTKVKQLVVQFLVNSDHQRYGELVRDIKNDFSLESRKYQETLSLAYDCLMNYKPSASNKQEKDKIGGLSFCSNNGDHKPSARVEFKRSGQEQGYGHVSTGG
jgi:hypothetical protein